MKEFTNTSWHGLDCVYACLVEVNVIVPDILAAEKDASPGSDHEALVGRTDAIQYHLHRGFMCEDHLHGNTEGYGKT